MYYTTIIRGSYDIGSGIWENCELQSNATNAMCLLKLALSAALRFHTRQCTHECRT